MVPVPATWFGRVADAWAGSGRSQALPQLRDQVTNFATLLTAHPAYRTLMASAWIHSIGNGLLSAGYMLILASTNARGTTGALQTLSVADSIIPVAASLIALWGTSEVEVAQPDEAEVARPEHMLAQGNRIRRARTLHKLASLALVDTILVGVMCGLTLNVATGGTMTVMLVAVYVAMRVLHVCKATMETHLYMASRQLLGREYLGDLMGPGHRTIPVLEASLGHIIYALGSQGAFLLATQLISPPQRFVAAAGLAMLGATVTATSKLWLAEHDRTRNVGPL